MAHKQKMCVLFLLYLFNFAIESFLFYTPFVCLFFIPEAHKLPYYASYSHVRLMIHNLCTNHYLDLFITFIICVNVVTMSLEHYSQPHVSVCSRLTTICVLGQEEEMHFRDLSGTHTEPL